MRLRAACVICLALGGPAAAQPAPQPEQPGTVATQATARATLPNTVADVVLKIEARGRSIAEVQQALATNSAALSAYLRSTSAEQARTNSVRVDPDLDPNPVRGQPARILGYDGLLSLGFQIDSAKLGEVLGGALQHGANAIGQTSLHPRPSEMDARRQSLAATATKIALDEARTVAEAAGRHLGAVRSLNVDSSYPGTVRLGMMPPPPAPAMAMAAPITTEIGSSEMSATVSVVVNLVEP